MGRDLEDVEGFPECLLCEGRRWIVEGATRHGDKTLPLEAPCPDCLPRLDVDAIREQVREQLK